MKKLLVPLSFCLLLLFFSSSVRAHSGGTNAAGCHNCRVGSCAGTYHCHNGGSGGGGGSTYRPSSVYVPPPQTKMPSTTATSELTANNHGSYTLEVDWDRPNAGQWSIALSKSLGADPGPLTDTTQSAFTFSDVKPGKYYVNIKEGLASGYWSDVSSWEVTVPAWVAPLPSPSPEVFRPRVSPHPEPKTETNTGDNTGFWNVPMLVGLFVLGGLAGVKRQKTA